MNKYIVTYVITRADRTREKDVLIIKEWTIEGALMQAKDTLDVVVSFDEIYEIIGIDEVA